MTIYYVSGAGNDKNNGLSETTAFRTLGRVFWLPEFKAGDTVLVMNGTYEKGGMIFNKNGTPDKWTTIKAYPEHKPFIKTVSDGINIFSSSYVRIEGLTLEGNRENITLEYATKEKNNTKNPLTTGNGICIKNWKNANGVGGTNPHHIVISNNIVRNFPGGGIAFTNSDYITVEKNIVSGNAWYSPYGCQGITALRSFNYDNNTIDYRIIFKENIVYDNKSLIPWIEVGKITEGHGLMLDTTKKTYDNVSYTGRALICNNIAYNNGGSGIHVFEAENVDVINNTCYQNALTQIEHGEIAVTYSKNVKAINNILYARTKRKCNYISNANNIIFNNNIGYNSTLFTDSIPKIVKLNNILNKDPLFIDATNKNFKLKPETPATWNEVKQEKSIVNEVQITKEEKILTKEDIVSLLQKLDDTISLDTLGNIKQLVDIQKTVQVEKLVDVIVKHEIGYTGN